jgi:exodeoxyribonuclease-3
MRLMTYNIFKGGQDDKSGDRTARLLEVITHAAPDVLALQECNGFDTDGEARLHRFEDALDMRGVLAQARDTGYHLAVLTRDCDHDCVTALHAGLHHAALQLEVAHAGQRMTVFCVHLSPFDAGDRLAEAQLLAARLPADRDAVVMGDLNALSPRDVPRYDPTRWPQRYRDRHAGPGTQLDTRAVAALEAAGLVDLAARAGGDDDTRPTPLLPGRPAQRLDYVFATAALARRLRGAQVWRSAAALQASDHLPVVVDLDD